MKRPLPVLLAAFAACAWSCQGATTVVTRETFQGVGTLNAAAPGNLGTVNAGSFFKRPVGPRLTSDTSAQGRGWSADAQGQINLVHFFSGAGFAGTQSSPAAPQPITSVRWWVYLGAPMTDGTDGKTLFTCQPNQTLLDVRIAGSDGLTLAFDAGQQTPIAPTVNPYALTVGVWTECQVVMQQITGYYDYQVEFLTRHAGDAQWTEVGIWPDIRTYANAGGVSLGFIGQAGTVAAKARYGLPGVYLLDAWSDRLTPTPGVVDPPAGPFQWYANAATGNDSNDGTTPAAAWASAAKIDAESANLGMIPTTAGYAAGDTLTIDTTTANLVLGTALAQFEHARPQRGAARRRPGRSG